jgi:hypothetical protein
MTAIPEPMQSIQSLIDDFHASHQEPPRFHLGASTLGHHCDRWLWLNFRWAVIEQFEGRILRLFRRGQNEEAVVVRDLRSIGMDVQATGAAQSRVDFGSHISGSIDGIIRSGVPEAPKKPHVLEIKTHSKKSFDDLEKNGVQKSKPMHWTQMQVYMYGLDIDRALYCAVCKDDDRIYTERVRLNKEAAEKAIARGQRIALSNRIPEPCPGAAPDWYQCKFCPAYQFCHQGNLSKEVNCRTCGHVVPMTDSTWHCTKHQDVIPKEYQLKGCDWHVMNTYLVPWKTKDSDSEWHVVFDVDGTPVKNGYGEINSEALTRNLSFAMSDDPFLKAAREKMGAKVVG